MRKFILLIIILLLSISATPSVVSANANESWELTLYFISLSNSSGNASQPPTPVIYERIIGTNPNATDGFDWDMDKPAPTEPQGDAFDVYFPCEHEVVTRLTTDIRSDVADEWKLNIEVPSQSTIHLRWDNSSLPEDEYFTIIVDGSETDMESKDMLELTGGTYEITVHMGDIRASSAQFNPSIRSSRGVGDTTEEYIGNIASKITHLQTVTAGSQVSYEFKNHESSISFIKFKGTTNAGQIKILIENLKNTSTLVNEKAPGRVYKNINIWVGNSFFDNNDMDNYYNMEDPLIGFRVSKDWISRNNVSTDSITLLHYSNGWEHGKPTRGSIASITRNAVDNKEWRSLETVQIDEDDKYFYFQAETVSFSPFAISSLDADNKPEAEMDEISKSADGITNSESKEFSDPEDSTIEVPSLSTIGRMLFGLIIGIVAVSTIRRLL